MSSFFLFAFFLLMAELVTYPVGLEPMISLSTCFSMDDVLFELEVHWQNSILHRVFVLS